MKVTSANISFNPENTPTSQDFNDVYFSNTNGVDETDYVFIGGNDLLSRWENHTHANFCIAETGFGTGLNFFRTIQHFKFFRQKNPEHLLTNLHFISTEKHPLTKADASNIYQKWRNERFLVSCDDEYADLAQWIRQYPLAVEGIHRRHFTNMTLKCEVVLDLHYGDAIDSLLQIQQTPNGLVDAWFLDGFAPSKNDSMWTQALYEIMARLSKFGCTFATFTAAGLVKRGLLAVGFNVEKRKGFGKKREMLIGTFSQDSCQQSTNDIQAALVYSDTHNSNMSFTPQKLKSNQAPYFIRTGSSNTHKITIVGNGLAGAMVALKLTQQGKKVELLWQGNTPADGASGNPVGGFYPQLNAQNNQASQLQLHSFLYAVEFYKSLNEQHAFEHQWCGALQLAFNENTQTRLSKLASSQLWPIDLARIVSAQQASEIAKVPIPYNCLHIPDAGWISPPSLVAACIEQAQSSGLLNLRSNQRILGYLSDENNGVSLQLSDGKQIANKTINTDTLIIALGEGCEPLLKKVVPLRLTRGQVEMVAAHSQHQQQQVLDLPNAPANKMSALQTLLCHKGYFTPQVNGFHSLGSTYVKNDLNCEPRQAETDANLDMHCESMKKANWLVELENARENKANYARAAIRCSTPDHLPVVGNVPAQSQFDELADLYKALPLTHYSTASVERNVFVLTGLGSRGLTTAPLMAEILVSQVLNKPMPLSKSLLDALNPNRFIVRSLIRRQTW